MGDEHPPVKRRVMRLALGEALPAPAELDLAVRNLERDDAEAVAELMFDAYRGTIDSQPSDTLEDARAEIEATFRGDYGELMPEASYVVFDGATAVSASIVTRYRGAPLIAFTMTGADRKGQGLSRALLTCSLHALAAAGDPHVDLVVTLGNGPAERLYASLGFTTVETFED